MPTHEHLPENWRGTRRDPRFPDAELGVAEDEDYVVFFDWPELDAYVRVPRNLCVELGEDGAFR